MSINSTSETLAIQRLGAIVICLIVLGAVLCQLAAQEPLAKGMTMTIESAFANGKEIPQKYTADGDDISPPIIFSGIPAKAKELALVCDDPDAPSAQPWVHWVIYRIPATTTMLPENLPAQAELTKPVTAVQGKNSWTSGRMIGYRGPAPPKGPAHHYQFKLYALDRALDLPAGIDQAALEEAMNGHVLDEAELVGTYSR
jgi:Raf kinase inhibitor-like YbhB/YbcL family protein